ncbi:hypothetical protein GCM10011385_31580 [Nitratireductor aestuarii]|uniref:Uncharacterized protein n=1 Tax=Nitratireductor aestuarii TaxID=1735103 RepID=A0A916RX14_9HYPH|nr:hypothetical protein GCM10011385_31580 [Nitratireductor aestuarii]
MYIGGGNNSRGGSNSYGVNRADKVNRDGTKDAANKDLFDRVRDAAQHIAVNTSSIGPAGASYGCGSCHDPYGDRSRSHSRGKPTNFV